SVAVWPTRGANRCPTVENDPVFGSNTTTESVGVASTDPPVMSVRPSFNATAAAPTRLSGVAPSDAHVPMACGSSARMLCVAAKTSAASITPSATRFFNVLTQPPVPTQDTSPVAATYAHAQRTGTFGLFERHKGQWMCPYGSVGVSLAAKALIQVNVKWR